MSAAIAAATHVESRRARRTRAGETFPVNWGNWTYDHLSAVLPLDRAEDVFDTLSNGTVTYEPSDRPERSGTDLGWWWQVSAESSRILVPVGESSTIRNTVAYAIREARAGAEGTDETPADADGADETPADADGADETPAVHFVFPARGRAVDAESLDDSAQAERLLERVMVWAREDLGYDDSEEAELDIEIETAVVGTDRYLFSPGDFAAVITEYAAVAGLSRIIVDPEFQPGGSAPMLRPFEVELTRSDFAVEEAPVERQTSRTRLVSRTTIGKGIATFGATYAFYLLIAGSLSLFNLATGGLTALLATIGFANITFVSSPSPRRTALRIARLGLFVPYLVWEITKANLSIAYIILHPDLPIDPEMRRFRAAVWGGIPVTTLANSITLTPGTLTVDVGRDGLDIHTLTGPARDDLAAGGLERAVRFVYYGRAGARIPTPTERESLSLVTAESTPSGAASGAETETGADSTGEVTEAGGET